MIALNFHLNEPSSSRIPYTLPSEQPAKTIFLPTTGVVFTAAFVSYSHTVALSPTLLAQTIFFVLKPIMTYLSVMHGEPSTLPSLSVPHTPFKVEPSTPTTLS